MDQNYLLLKSKAFFAILLLTVILSLPVNAQLLDPLTQTKFVNPLPVPAQIDATQGIPLEMQMNETSQWLGLTDPATNAPLMTKVWGYGPANGIVTYPGPTFIAKRDVPVTVTWHNNLPSTGHFLPVDPTIHIAHPHGTDPATFYAAGNVPAVVHLHGGNTESASDGLPEAWYTQNLMHTGPQYVKQTFTYHNSQEAATIWYHDHALGITRLNVYAGLAGFYLLEDKRERDLVQNNVLPKGSHDIEIVIQDRMFDSDGQLFLPSKTGDPWFGDALGEPLELPYDPSVVAEFFGNFIVVNGVVWPYLEVEPRPYRFRLLNGSDSRFYILEFGKDENKMDFLQIATDNGLLPNAVSLDQLVIAPGERAEVIVDFTGKEDQFITLYNYGPDAPFKGTAANQEPADSATTAQIMQFQVTQKLKDNKGNPIPTVTEGTYLRPPLEDLGPADTTRYLALFEGEDSDGRLQPLLGIINGDEEKTTEKPNGSLAWFEPITENPELDAVEEWWVFNATEDAHPIHLHLVTFQIMERRPFSAIVMEQDQIQHNDSIGSGGYILQNTVTEGAQELPAENEKGWKDTFIVPPGYVGKIKAKFNRPGRYVWHCHILSHEDHEMMRPFHVGPLPMPYLKSTLANNSASDTDILNKGPEDSPQLVIYPNPASDFTNLRFRLEQPSPVLAKIYDIRGSEILSQYLGSFPSGHHSYRLDIGDIKKGVYIFELLTNEGRFRERILIMK